MSEKVKRKPDPQSSFLTPDDASSFSHTISAPIEPVRWALANLQSTDGILNHSVVVTPSSDGYEFRYEIVRPGGMGSGLSAYAQGFLHENEQGQTIVEGTIHIAMPDNQFLLLCGVSVIILPLLLLLLPVLMLLATQRGDTRRIRDKIAQMAANTTPVPVINTSP